MNKKKSKVALPIWIDKSIADFFRMEAGKFRSRNEVIVEILYNEKERILTERAKKTKQCEKREINFGKEKNDNAGV